MCGRVFSVLSVVVLVLCVCLVDVNGGATIYPQNWTAMVPSTINFAMLTTSGSTWQAAAQAWVDLSSSSAPGINVPASVGPYPPTFPKTGMGDAHIGSFDFNLYSWTTLSSSATNDVPMSTLLTQTNAANKFPAAVNLTGMILDGQDVYIPGLSYLLNYLQVPLISCTVNDVEMMDRVNFGHVFSTQTPDLYTLQAALEVMRMNGWKRMAFVATTDLIGQNWAGLANHALIRSAYPEMEIAIFYVPSLDVYQSSQSTFNHTCQTTFDAIKRQGYTILFLAPLNTVAAYVMMQAYVAGVTGQPYQWMGNTYACQSSGSQSLLQYLGGQYASIVNGFICFQQGYPRNLLVQSARSTWQTTSSFASASYSLENWNAFRPFMYASGVNLKQSNYVGWQNNPSLSWDTCYESVYMLAAAVKIVEANNQTVNGSNIIAALPFINFTGPMTGIRYTFDPVTQLVIGAPVDILTPYANSDGSNPVLLYIGSYVSDSHELVLSQPITYSTTNSTAGLDYIPVYSDGSTIPVSYLSYSIILAILAPLLSQYTTQMALTAGVYAKRRAKDPTKQMTKSWASLPYRQFRHWWTAPYGLMLIAALCQGLGTLAVGNYLLYSTLNLPAALSLYFTTASVAMTGVFTSMLSCIAFFTVLSSVEYNSLSRFQSLDGLNQSATHSEGSLTKESNDSSSGSLRTDKMRQSNPGWMKRMEQYMTHWIAKYCNKHVYAATLLTTAAVVLSSQVSRSGWALPADTSVRSVGLFFLVPCLLWWPLLIGLSDSFYRPYQSTVKRVGLALLTVIVMLSEDLLVTAAYRVTFSKDKYDNSTWSSVSMMSASNMVLAICGVMAAVLFLYIALLMESSKLSKNTMDVLLQRTHEQLRSQETNAAAVKRRCALADTHLSHLRHCLEIITVCRPLARTHAVAWVMTGAGQVTSSFKASDAQDSRLTLQSVVAVVKDDTAAVKMMESMDTNRLLMTEQTETATARRSPITLTAILNNVACLELVKDELAGPGMKKCGGVEILMLWLDCQRYKSITDPALRASIGRSIVDTFLIGKSGSKPHVQLNPTVVSAVSKNFNGPIVAAVNALSEVESTVLDRMHREVMPALMLTPTFRICELILDAHRAYNINATKTA